MYGISICVFFFFILWEPSDKCISLFVFLFRPNYVCVFPGQMYGITVPSKNQSVF